MKELQKDIKRYLKERDWDNLRPSDIAKSISIESAELLELFQWQNLSLDEVKKDKKKIEEIKDELSDVLIYCLELAALLDIDSEKIARDKLERIEEKYPAEVMKNRDREPGTEDMYWKIKNDFRSKKFKNS
jgi:dCTP diphosphatase